MKLDSAHEQQKLQRLQKGDKDKMTFFTISI